MAEQTTSRRRIQKAHKNLLTDLLDPGKKLPGVANLDAEAASTIVLRFIESATFSKKHRAFILKMINQGSDPGDVAEIVRSCFSPDTAEKLFDELTRPAPPANLLDARVGVPRIILPHEAARIVRVALCDDHGIEGSGNEAAAEAEEDRLSSFSSSSSDVIRGKRLMPCACDTFVYMVRDVGLDTQASVDMLSHLQWQIPLPLIRSVMESVFKTRLIPSPPLPAPSAETENGSVNAREEGSDAAGSSTGFNFVHHFVEPIAYDRWAPMERGRILYIYGMLRNRVREAGNSQDMKRAIRMTDGMEQAFAKYQGLVAAAKQNQTHAEVVEYTDKLDNEQEKNLRSFYEVCVFIALSNPTTTMHAASHSTPLLHLAHKKKYNSAYACFAFIRSR